VKKKSKPQPVDLDKIWADLPVALTKQQAQVCKAIVSQDLMHTCELIGKNQDGSGNPLDEQGRYNLVRFSMETQFNSIRFIGARHDQPGNRANRPRFQSVSHPRLRHLFPKADRQETVATELKMNL
jgi:hypothetical protein